MKKKQGKRSNFYLFLLSKLTLLLTILFTALRGRLCARVRVYVCVCACGLGTPRQQIKNLSSQAIRALVDSHVPL